MPEFAQPLDDRLYITAVSVAAAAGFVLGDGADHFLHSQAERAAEQLARGQGPGLDVAEHNFRALVTAMIAERDTAYGVDAATHNLIGEVTLGAALAKLCPLWPFCD